MDDTLSSHWPEILQLFESKVFQPKLQTHTHLVGFQVTLPPPTGRALSAGAEAGKMASYPAMPILSSCPPFQTPWPAELKLRKQALTHSVTKQVFIEGL